MEKILLNQKKHYDANTDNVLAYQTSFRKRNKDKVREWGKKYSQTKNLQK